jgi:hypothetical protein
MDLINSVAEKKVGNFKILAWQIAYTCHLIPDSEESTSVLAMDWKHLPRSKVSKEILTNSQKYARYCMSLQISCNST